MSLSVLNNVSATYATNNLNKTSNSLSTVLQQLSSGSKINSGADDAAGLSLVNGLQANQNALAQSANNATEGIGLLQVADGALSQVTSLLDRAITLATESANGTLNTTQVSAANQEYQSILSEITNIGATTTYNQQKVFGNSYTIYTGDSSSSGASFDNLIFASLNASTGSVGDQGGSISYSSSTLGGTISYATGSGVTLASSLTYSTAASALTSLNSAVTAVSAQDGYIGAQINLLSAISNVETSQQTNIQSAQNAVQATDYASASSNMSKYEILSQTGISALAQANSVQQQVTKLLS
jgi:flagellin